MRITEPLIFEDTTDTLMTLFNEQNVCLYQELVGAYYDHEEAARIHTVITAGQLARDLIGNGKYRQYLADWHRSAKLDCSRLYADLGDEYPRASREDIRSDEELQKLNGIRRGLHYLMVRAQPKSKPNKLNYRTGGSIVNDW